MTFKKLSQRTEQLFLTKGMRCAYAQNPDRLVVGLAQFIFQRHPGIRNALCMLIAAFAIIRQLHRMGGAQEQLDAKQRFQRLQPAADRRLRRLQLARRRRQRPGLHDTDIRPHQIHPIYTLLPFHYYFTYTFHV